MARLLAVTAASSPTLMLHALSVLILWLGLLAPEPQATPKLEFHARAEGQDVRAVVRIRVPIGWHMYAPVLGTPNVAGQASQLEFEAQGVQWGEPVWPNWKTHAQEFGRDGQPATANVYYGTVLVRAAGRLDEGASLTGAAIRLRGQICEDDGVCVQFDEQAQVQTPGVDTVFADFPADLVFTPAAAAQPEPAAAADSFEPFEDPEARAKVELFSRVAGAEAQALIRISIDDEWHLYHEDLGKPDAAGMPSVVELSAPGVEWGPVTWPTPHEAPQEFGLEGEPTTILQHEGVLLLFARGKLGEGADVAKANVTITGQTCDANVCLQFKAAVRSSGAGDDALFAKTASASPQVAGVAGEPRPEDVGLLEFIGLCVLGGLLALLMPCTYPMIPITISFFTKQAAAQGGSRWRLSLLYGVGIVLMFILIGVVVGAAIIEFATHPTTNLVFALAFVVFGLSLLGLFNLQPPEFLMNFAGKARSAGGLLGIFLMGATLVITSFTCTTPIVGAILPVAAGAGGGVDYLRVVLGMGAFGLTMATPFVVLSLIPGRLSAIPRSGEWMNTLKVTLGFVELAAALKFLSNADVLLRWNALSKELFLVLWFGIFVVAAAYLLGLIRYKGDSGEVGGGRLLSGLLSFLFSLYCLFCALGGPLDFVMAAMAPPYSAFETSHLGAGAAAPRDHAIVVDDLEGAKVAAKEQGKLVLVNFTGHT